MIEAVFISDLHLHPQEFKIQQYFNEFIQWAKSNAVEKVYILGDFFHAWAGDDSLDDWSRNIALQIAEMNKSNIKLFHMAGNRDFLLGDKFAQLANWTVIKEPAVIQLGTQNILLVHGDRYCTRDRSHQWFRWITRNKWFVRFFLLLPLKYRHKLVNTVRQHSKNTPKNYLDLDAVESEVLYHMKNTKVNFLIHGHTHKAKKSVYPENRIRYVLSDWDDKPKFLCYDGSKGFYFAQF